MYHRSPTRSWGLIEQLQFRSDLPASRGLDGTNHGVLNRASMKKWLIQVLAIVACFFLLRRPLEQWLLVDGAVATLISAIGVATLVPVADWLLGSVDFNHPVPRTFTPFMTRHMRMIPIEMLSGNRVLVKFGKHDHKNIVRVSPLAKLSAWTRWQVSRLGVGAATPDA